ncbi:MAG: hypothetical protein AAGF75_00970 [Cyanobacteria bacterium P01_H01_bin.130]
MAFNSRSPLPKSLTPYPLDTTFVRCLKAALHERNPRQFFPELASELAKPGEISALNRFFRLIPQMPDLYRHPHPQYTEALNDALQTTDKRLTQFQCNWQGDTDTQIRWRFMRWFNTPLRYRIKDLYRQAWQQRGKAPLSLDCAITDSSATTLGDTVAAEGGEGVKLSGLDALIEAQQREKTQRQGLLVELYIEQDPDCTLQGCQARKAAQLNCQSVAQKMLLRLQGGKVGKLAPEKRLSWRMLAEQLAVKEQTVHSHWKRKCLPLLQKIARTIEAQSDLYAQKLLGLSADADGNAPDLSMPPASESPS